MFPDSQIEPHSTDWLSVDKEQHNSQSKFMIDWLQAHKQALLLVHESKQCMHERFLTELKENRRGDAQQ